MTVVWQNGKVALIKDLIFGLCVMAESGWTPCANLDLADLLMVEKLIDYNPGFPFKEELAALLNDAKTNKPV